ncbi:hypothetical protein [Ktedonobacter sp. SOSP1-85]|uniref:hypothetical protein n=1 Tax=Ktedonobacter sp. SOSP1-85 TaxID=2778367 RepID=UPI001915F8C6|nr:hypothetical protein [Ktedonobacter sp. SOSP1-85]
MQLSGASQNIYSVVVIIVVVTVVTLHRHPFSASSECWWLDGQNKKPSSFGGRGHQLLFACRGTTTIRPEQSVAFTRQTSQGASAGFIFACTQEVKPSRVNGRDPEGTATAPSVSFFVGGSLPGSGVSLSRTNCDACSHGIALCVLG